MRIASDFSSTPGSSNAFSGFSQRQDSGRRSSPEQVVLGETFGPGMEWGPSPSKAGWGQPSTQPRTWLVPQGGERPLQGACTRRLKWSQGMYGGDHACGRGQVLVADEGGQEFT